jgi:hypothetical protein
MKIIDIVTYIMCAIIIWISFAIFNAKKDNDQSYNCSLAEISPDFTPAMREVCRKLRREQQ